MKLFTKIAVEPQNHQIDYTSKILLMGSCFVENIGDKLSYYKFDTLQNPFGILFHPLAIEKLIKRALTDSFFTENDVFYHNEKWHCFEVHSVLSSNTKEALLEKLNTKLRALKTYVLNATHIVFTYGTSWVYRYIKTKQFVANCYKIQQQKFTKELLALDEIYNAIQNTLLLITKENPKVTILTTVSPVRHIKDGITQNSVSKAHLIAGLQKFLNQKDSLNNQYFYFPSYEIMMDELRDYRFYKSDLIHPSDLAIEIIWERFTQAWISPETQEIRKNIASIQKALAHKPYNPSSKEQVLFQEKIKNKIETITKKLPNISFDK